MIKLNAFAQEQIQALDGWIKDSFIQMDWMLRESPRILLVKDNQHSTCHSIFKMCTVNKMWMAHNQLNEWRFRVVPLKIVWNLEHHFWFHWNEFSPLLCELSTVWDDVIMPTTILSAICAKIRWAIMFPCAQPSVLCEFWFKHLWNWLRFKLREKYIPVLKMDGSLFSTSTHLFVV